jgi:DHA2 family multidrug resistance protein
MVPVFSQGILGFTAMKSGMLQLPGALASIIMMPVMGKLLQRGVKPQILITAGFCIIAAFAFSLSRLTAEANYFDFFWPLIIRNTGMACLFIPLTVLALADLEPRDIPQGTALNNMMRQIGGSFGIALINTYVDNRAAAHRLQLVSHVSLLEPATRSRLAMIQSGLAAKGAATMQEAYRALEGAVVKQTMTMSYLDAFRILGFLCLFCVPLVLTIRPKKKLTGAIDTSAAH